jgi:SAM-dependent methyltransferase
MSRYRDYNAEYYDLDTTQTDDIDFYQSLVSSDSLVLELGCGTGRVSIPLADTARTVTAVDLSDTMLDRARKKDHQKKVSFVRGDICSIKFQERFDLIIAPFRVFQALEHPAQVSGLMGVIREHLKKDGVAFLNVFNPKFSREEMGTVWCRHSETHYDELVFQNGDILKTSDLRQRIDADNQVMYPTLIYRRFRDGKLIDEHRNPICMKYYYPDEFKKLILDHGFEVTQAWGGYRGEAYGVGPELLIGFKLRA